ncbi:hypothetical protein GCM10009818_15430 [Nakamurella flavida]
MHGVGPADRGRRGLGQAEVQDLPLGHQCADRSGRFLDGRVRVDPMLVVQVDPVGTQALQGSFDGGADVDRTLLSTAPGPPPEWETRPNLVAMTTPSRRPDRARPTTSSLWKGP